MRHNNDQIWRKVIFAKSIYCDLVTFLKRTLQFDWRTFLTRECYNKKKKKTREHIFINCYYFLNLLLPISRSWFVVIHLADNITKRPSILHSYYTDYTSRLKTVARLNILNFDEIKYQWSETLFLLLSRFCYNIILIIAILTWGQRTQFDILQRTNTYNRYKCIYKYQLNKIHLH